MYSGFSLFDLDNLPPFEPLENTLVLLRENPNDTFALQKLIDGDPMDIMDHPQWTELLSLLKKSVLGDDESSKVLSLSLLLKYASSLGVYQALESILCIFESAWKNFVVENAQCSQQMSSFQIGLLRSILGQLVNKDYRLVDNPQMDRVKAVLQLLLVHGKITSSDGAVVSLLAFLFEAFSIEESVQFYDQLSTWLFLMPLTSVIFAVQSGLLQQVTTAASNQALPHRERYFFAKLWLSMYRQWRDVESAVDTHREQEVKVIVFDRLHALEPISLLNKRCSSLKSFPTPCLRQRGQWICGAPKEDGTMVSVLCPRNGVDEILVIAMNTIDNERLEIESAMVSAMSDAANALDAWIHRLVSYSDAWLSLVRVVMTGEDRPPAATDLLGRLYQQHAQSLVLLIAWMQRVAEQPEIDTTSIIECVTCITVDLMHTMEEERCGVAWEWLLLEAMNGEALGNGIFRSILMTNDKTVMHVCGWLVNVFTTASTTRLTTSTAIQRAVWTCYLWIFQWLDQQSCTIQPASILSLSATLMRSLSLDEDDAADCAPLVPTQAMVVYLAMCFVQGLRERLPSTTTALVALQYALSSTPRIAIQAVMHFAQDLSLLVGSALQSPRISAVEYQSLDAHTCSEDPLFSQLLYGMELLYGMVHLGWINEAFTVFLQAIGMCCVDNEVIQRVFTQGDAVSLVTAMFLEAEEEQRGDGEWAVHEALVRSVRLLQTHALHSFLLRLACMALEHPQFAGEVHARIQRLLGLSVEAEKERLWCALQQSVEAEGLDARVAWRWAVLEKLHGVSTPFPAIGAAWFQETPSLDDPRSSAVSWSSLCLAQDTDTVATDALTFLPSCVSPWKIEEAGETMPPLSSSSAQTIPLEISRLSPAAWSLLDSASRREQWLACVGSVWSGVWGEQLWAWHRAEAVVEDSDPAEEETTTVAHCVHTHKVWLSLACLIGVRTETDSDAGRRYGERWLHTVFRAQSVWFLEDVEQLTMQLLAMHHRGAALRILESHAVCPRVLIHGLLVHGFTTALSLEEAIRVVQAMQHWADTWPWYVSAALISAGLCLHLSHALRESATSMGLESAWICLQRLSIDHRALNDCIGPLLPLVEQLLSAPTAVI